jgi:hypothetical protein
MQLRRQWHRKRQGLNSIIGSPSPERLPCDRYEHIRPNHADCGQPWYIWLG